MPLSNSMEHRECMCERLASKNCQSKQAGKNLVVCLDGTAQKFGEHNTNVIELYYALEKDDRQVTFYNSGIGTYAAPSWKMWKFRFQQLENLVDRALAFNIDKEVLLAYRWLSDSYNHGDKIFLFGFSRGAYQVRCLSAMIEKVGLIHKGNEAQIPFAYELYAATGEPGLWKSSTEYLGNILVVVLYKLLLALCIFKICGQVQDQGKGKKTEDDPHEMAKRFKDTFARDIGVHFVGAWDTVSSVGLVRGSTLPGTTSGMKHACFFRHALALDEKRVKFLPEYAYEGSSLPPDSKEATAEISDRSQCIPHTKKVWFPGSHSDIGGGNVMDAKADRPSLRWMSYEAILAGLRVKPFEHLGKSRSPVNIEESLVWYWWPLEIIPFQRPSYKGPSWIKRPHMGNGRHLRKGQMIHSSLLLREQRPAASLAYFQDPEYETWEVILKTKPIHGQTPLFIELDFLDRAIQFVGDVRSAKPNDILPLVKEYRSLMSFSPVFGAIREVDEIKSFPDVILQTRFPVKAQKFIRRTMQSYISADPDCQHKEVSLRADSPDESHIAVVRFFSNNIRLYKKGNYITNGVFEPLLADLDVILTLAFSPNGRQLACGSGDGHVVLWNVHECDIYQRQEEHKEPVSAIVYSMDGKFIASGGADGTVKLWGPLMQSEAPPSEPARDTVPMLPTHTISFTLPPASLSTITSLTFSSDCTFLAAGSSSGRIFCWNIQSMLGPHIGQNTPIEPHNVLHEKQAQVGPVICIAITPDNKHLISGHHDWTMRVWDRNSGSQITSVLYGHASGVTSISIKGNIMSSVDDYSCRKWSIKTGRAHGVSPNISFDILSSETLSVDDNLPTLPSGETYETDHKPLYHHAGEPFVVAFSPDGNHIASSSGNHLIRLWDSHAGVEVMQPRVGHIGHIRSVRYSPAGDFIASGSDDATVCIWDANTGQQEKRLAGHRDSINSIDFSPDASHIVSGSKDGTFRVWKVDVGEKVGSVHVGGGAVLCVRYKPDKEENTIACGCLEKDTITLWNLDTLQELFVLRGHTGGICSLSFSPNGCHIVSGSLDETIRVWDTKTESPVTESERHGSDVHSVTYSPDGEHIISTTITGIIRLRNAKTKTKNYSDLHRVGEGHVISAVAFSPDSQYIASASNSSTICRWDAGTREAVAFSD